MALTVYANWAPKSGHRDSEYEDAFAFQGGCRSTDQGDWTRCRIAVADGATDSWSSGRWARLLARAAAQGRLTPNRFADQFRRLRTRWHRNAVPADLSWVSEEKARGGGHAAILTATIRSPRTPGGEGVWSAWVIGDCCLFQLRAGRMVTSFPYARPEDFTCSPILLGTASDADTVSSLREEWNGTWRPEDEFVLATDAMALWILERVDEAGWYDKSALADAIQPRTQTDFAAWVGQARGSGQLRNDDTTLVSLRTS